MPRRGRNRSRLVPVETRNYSEVLSDAGQVAADAARGSVSALVGLPGDVGSLTSRQAAWGALSRAPTTEQVGKALGADTDSVAFELGQWIDPTGPFGKVAKGATALAAAGPFVRRATADAGELAARGGLPKLQARDFVEQPGSQAARRRFADRLEGARSFMDPQDAAQVDPLPATSDPHKWRLFMTPDEEAGFAIDPGNTLVNLFRHPESQTAGTMSAALTKARAEGATGLQGFDTYLAPGYLRRGAVERGRFPFDPEYAPPGWDTNVHGQPDYVDMAIGGVFEEYPHSRIVGPREQKALERYQPARGEPGGIPALFRGGRSQRLYDLARQGVAEGGDRWYHTGGIKDQFINVLDEAEGAESFDRYMDYVAALSPRGKVDQNLRRASIPYQLWRQGEMPEALTHEMFPPGYGHMATRSAHSPAVSRLYQTGAVGSSIDQPKISSFAENLKGNYIPLTADSHNFQIIAQPLIGAKAARSPSGTEYPFLEARQSKMAERLGLKPAEWQSALWVGGKDITGVADSMNITGAMNKRIARTAETLGVSEEEAMRRFIRGDTRLYGLGAGAMMTPLMLRDYGEDNRNL